jgi:KEOPS complex subunit Pcc1
MSTLNVEKSEAEITLQMTEETADIIIKALKPEADTPSSNRSNTLIEKNYNRVTIHVSANDTTALRASVNSYLHWVQGIIDMVREIK